MTRYLSLNEVLDIYIAIMEQSGGAVGIRDIGALESSIAQPRMGFGGEDLYPETIDKAMALCYSLVMNHPFVDGNKRIGHAAMEVFLLLNGQEIESTVDEQEKIILDLAAGKMSRYDLNEWLKAHVKRSIL